jgi:hypothetical protein
MSDQSRNLDYQLSNVPDAAAKVRLRVPADRGNRDAGLEKPLSRIWDLPVMAESVEEMFTWLDENTEGMRTIRMEYLDGSGGYVASHALNPAGVIEADYSQVAPEARRREIVADATALTTKELLMLAATNQKDNQAAFIALTSKFEKVATDALQTVNRLSGHVVQLGSDNSTRAEGTMQLLLGELLAAKDEARAASVSRAEDKTPGEAESDGVKLVRELVPMFDKAQSKGLSSFVGSLMKGETKAVETLKEQLKPYSQAEKAAFLAKLVE